MKPLTVLYYHRILPFKGYDIDIDTFEWQLAFLKKRFDIVPPEALFDLRKGIKLKRPSVMLTFDDGFMDNYTYASPILESLKIKALLFVITSKVLEKKSRTFQKPFIPAKNESKIYKTDREFLSSNELRTLKKIGTFSIGSHSHNHKKVFVSDKVIGIWKNEGSAHWSYEYAVGEKPQQGFPIFEMASELSKKRFYPSPEFLYRVREIYKNCKDEKETLEQANLLEQKGYFESDYEFKRKVERDLKTSKELIEKQLSIDVHFLSWPWGEFSETSLEIAKNLGFEFCFTTEKRAFFGGNFCRIGRVKAPNKKTSFTRKLTLNRYTTLATLYRLWHG